MGHVQDRWYKTVKDPDSGKPARIKTNLHGTGMRYKVRYLDPDGNEKSRMYPDKCKRQADDFLLEMESSKREGKYVDPRAGRIKFRRQAENWIKGLSPNAATREALSSRLESQIYPHFGELPVNAVNRGRCGTGWEPSMRRNSARIIRRCCSLPCRPSWTQRWRTS